MVGKECDRVEHDTLQLRKEKKKKKRKRKKCDRVEHLTLQLRNSGAEQQASRASTTLKWLFSTAKCSAVLPPSLICHVTCQTPPRLRLCVSSFTHTHTHTQHTHTHTHTHYVCVRACSVRSRDDAREGGEGKTCMVTSRVPPGCARSIFTIL